MEGRQGGAEMQRNYRGCLSLYSNSLLIKSSVNSLPLNIGSQFSLDKLKIFVSFECSVT